MPLYEYRCFACGSQFEKLVGHAAADGVTCPSCGDVHAKRLLSLVAPISRRAAAGTTTMSSDWSAGGGCGCTSCSCGHAH